MKRFSIIISLFFLFFIVYSEDTIPQILIEGTELEDINIGDTGNIKVKLKDTDDDHKKQAIKEKENKIPEALKNQYKFELAFGNNIFTKMNLQGNFFLKKLSILPVFSYYHNYPYIRNNYFESFLGEIKGIYNENAIKMTLNIKNHYSIYQYADEQFIKKNDFNSNILAEFFPSSELYISYLLQFLKINISNDNEANEIGNFKNILFGKIYMDKLSIRFKVDWDMFINNAPTYYIYVLGAYSGHKINGFMGISGYKQIEKGIYPMLGMNYLLLKDFQLFLKTDIEKIQEENVPLKPHFDQNHDPYNMAKKAEFGTEYSKDMVHGKLSLLYKENLNYPVIEFKDPIYYYTKGVHNYPLFVKGEFSIISNWILKFSYSYNYKKVNNMPLNIGKIFFYFPLKKFGFTGEITYNDITYFKNGILPADLLYHFNISYGFWKTFSCGLGIIKTNFNADINAKINYYIFIKGTL